MSLARAAGLAAWLACGLAHAGTLEVLVRTPAGKPLEDAAVVLEALAGTPPPRAGRATIAQHDREFSPYLSIVQTGTAVEFPNRDPFKHHIYSFSPAKTFEIKLYAGKPARPVVFDRPGEVALGCNIHDWMEAYVLVVDSPYFAKTDAAGRAVIAHAPAGGYRLRLWHPRQAAAPDMSGPGKITLGAAPLRLERVLDAAPRIAKPKPPMDADSY